MHRLPRHVRGEGHPADLGAGRLQSGPNGRNLATLRTPSGKRRFERRGNKLYQNSMVEKDLAWEVVQTADTIDPGSDHYNEKSHLAKTVRFNGAGQMGVGNASRPERPEVRPTRTRT